MQYNEKYKKSNQSMWLNREYNVITGFQACWVLIWPFLLANSAPLRCVPIVCLSVPQERTAISSPLLNNFFTNHNPPPTFAMLNSAHWGKSQVLSLLLLYGQHKARYCMLWINFWLDIKRLYALTRGGLDVFVTWLSNCLKQPWLDWLM